MSMVVAAPAGGAGAADLPRALVDPPWAPGCAGGRTVVGGLVCADPPTVRWAPGERDAWLAMAATVARPSSGPGRGSGPGSAPPRSDPGRSGSAVELTGRSGSAALLVAVARQELGALPAVLAAARRAPARCAGALAPLASAEVATLMAELLATRPALRPLATAWLSRHAPAAARALLPAALGRPGRARWRAERALLTLAGCGHGAAVTAAAAGYGPAAVRAAAQVLAIDPADLPPLRMPAMPAWVDAGTLPPVALVGGGTLPPPAVGHLLTLLALSSLDEPHPALADAVGACDRAGLAEFGWVLFERWRAAGAPRRQYWVLHALGPVGDDGTACRLAPLIQAWPTGGGHVRAAVGVAVLAAMGSPAALTQLDTIARRARSGRLRALAAARLHQIAEARGMHPEALADRIVPDLGLDPAGRTTVDYGPRRFTVTFDERLRPVVTDAAGRGRATLPRPAASDDPVLAPAGLRRFQQLRREVRAVVGHQAGRLELAMVTQRRWRLGEFRDLFMAHPLLWHLVRRLVLVHQGGAVRAAEDHTLADLADRPVRLADTAPIGIAHPLQLGADRAGWAELLADYAIRQPFPQVGREVFELPTAERNDVRLGRFTGVVVPTRRLLGMQRRGWRRAEPGDGGVHGWLERQAADGRSMVVSLDPGIAACDPDLFPEQVLEEIWVCGPGDSRWGREHSTPIGDIDRITLSEVVRDLQEVTR